MFSDLVTARLRTIVPVLWGSAVAWALAQWPDFGHAVSSFGVDPTSPAVAAAVVAACIYAWDYLWKRVEDVLPAWLTRIVVGSNLTPTYAPTTADGAQVITTLPVSSGGTVQDSTTPDAEDDVTDDPDADAEEPVTDAADDTATPVAVAATTADPAAPAA